jgi:hypothetical protein
MMTGNDPAAAIRQGLLDRGIPAHVADGFLMNFRDESGLRTDINEAAPIVPGSRGGFGLAQWTGPRRRELEAFAQSRGVPASDMNAQLDFLMAELQGSESRAAQSIFAAPDSATAADAILRQFLRPAAEHRERRSAAYLGGQAMPFAQPQGGQQPMQQPGLLGTMSTMNQQQPRDPSIWDALVGRLPERAQGIAGRTIGDADWRDRLAIGLAGMSMRPNEALIDTLQGRMDDRSQERRINQTAAYLESIGRPDLAAAMLAGLEPNTAIAEAMRPPEQPRPIEINGQLVDPTTGQVIGDYRDPGGQNREMRPDQNGVLRYVDDGTEVFPGVTAPVGPALSGDQLTAANTLRDDLTNNLRPFELSREGWQSVQTFYTNPGGVSDKALVVAFAKILDPGSVVREGESAAIASAGSLPVALQQQLLAALDGRGQLPQAVREEIAALSADLYKNQATRAGEIIENFRGVADQAGLPFESVYLGAPVDPRAGTAKTNNPAPSRAPAPPPPATTAPPPATGAPASASPAATTPPPSVPVAPSYAANQTIQALAQSLGITVQEMWDMLPEEERAQWPN